MYKPSKGFTLLEMIVAVGLFSILMLISLSSYLTLISLDRESRTTNELVSNLSFAVESMSRALRTGTNYACSPGDSNGNSTTGSCHQITFTDSNNCTVTYRNTGGVLTQTTSGTGCSVGTNVPLTTSKIALSTSDPQGLTFYVRGVSKVGAEASRQPKVTFILRGQMQVSPTKTEVFTIEGGATQRFIEL